MTELDPQELRRALVIEQAIDAELDTLVRRANDSAALFKESQGMEESQLRNLLNVAVTSRSVEVVVNFIRYQMGRTGRAWTPTIGHRVISDVRWASGELAATVRENAGKKLLPQALTPEHGADIPIELVQRYLGYLSRAFYYGKKMNSFDELKEVPSAK